MIIRMARHGDKAALHAIWDECFHDEAAFTDWYFDRRFVPRYSVVAESDGQIAACMHALPLHVAVRGVLLPAAMVAGVATRPAYRGQGLMRRVMTHFMNEMRRDGIALTPHRPEQLNMYYGLGHYPMCDAQFVKIESCDPPLAGDALADMDPAENADAMLHCYTRFAARYSFIVSRTYADFLLKLEDFAASGARCAAVWQAGELQGYALYTLAPDLLDANECVALSDEAYQALYEGLRTRAKGRALTLRLPPDVRLEADGALVSRMPRSVTGVANVGMLLRATGLRGHAIEVLDSVVPANAGVYTLSGEPTDAQTAMTVSAGRLAQWAVGYRSAEDLVKTGDAVVRDEGIVQVMDQIGLAPCYMLDEY